MDADSLKAECLVPVQPFQNIQSPSVKSRTLHTGESFGTALEQALEGLVAAAPITDTMLPASAAPEHGTSNGAATVAERLANGALGTEDAGMSTCPYRIPGNIVHWSPFD